ncbi:PREDICTED: vinexin [Corvus brachyrhynchos]|uniref:vinexin n=1 Tax=Corvus brachyrhynchos TaxID=85066 RepID=UPI0008164E50|nr:PREDICTED: vinexin [Corvus brachyrhynchos]
MERGGLGLASNRSHAAPGRDTLRPGTLPSLSDLGDPVEAVKREEKKMKAARLKFDFQAESPKELTLHKGDIVYIHKEVDRNWLEGEHHGRVGIFPSNYVEVSPGQPLHTPDTLRMRNESQGALRTPDPSLASLAHPPGSASSEPLEQEFTCPSLCQVSRELGACSGQAEMLGGLLCTETF